jgi:hypothetical protein
MMPITLNFGRLDMSNLYINTSQETLDRLANDESSYVRCEVAINPNTPPETLERLAGDKDSDVRCYVAWNPNTPTEILELMANDGDYWVRRGVAGNPNTPQYIRTYLKIKEVLNYYE